MSKKPKSPQFTQQQKPQSIPNVSMNSNNFKPSLSLQRVQPEQMSLMAHEHIQKYLKNSHENHLEQEDLNAVLRLSQHLRIFGLLSAVGYINQSNDQEGKVRLRTVPVWKCLLEQLIAPEETLTNQQLMTRVVEMTRNHPQQYLATWRKSLLLTNHWNFWARAYSA